MPGSRRARRGGALSEVEEKKGFVRAPLPLRPRHEGKTEMSGVERRYMQGRGAVTDVVFAAAYLVCSFGSGPGEDGCRQALCLTLLPALALFGLGGGTSGATRSTCA